MKIHIPNSAFLGNIDNFLRGFDPKNLNTLKITANPRWISVHPFVLCMIATLGKTVTLGNIECDSFEAKSRHYLERMGLFRMLGVESGISITEHEEAGRFIPLTQIRTSSELTNFISEMIPLLHLDSAQAEPIAYIISELGRNVIEHAKAEGGAILAAQYYKKSNAIRIGIADTGIGIKKTIGQSHYAKTDLEAIRLALQPGVTGTTQKEGGTEQNAGAGLFFIKSMASVSSDFFVAYSGSAMYKLLKSRKKTNLSLKADPFDDRHSKDDNLPYFPGTVVGIDITLNQTKEFTSLLDSIGKTYSTAIRDRKKARHRKPKFT